MGSLGQRSEFNRNAIGKPSIVAVLEALKGPQGLDDTEHGWKSCRCPFHDDRSASASYNTILQMFQCHACGFPGNRRGKPGDGYDVIMEVERCDFATAKNRVAELGTTVVFTGEPRSLARSKLTSRRTKERARLVRKTYGRRR